MSVRAIAKGVRMSPRKVFEVASLVRGRTVEEALTILSHTPRRAALPVKKVIESARANAEHNHNLKPDTLKIVLISVTPGPSIKRFRPVAHGRALPFQHRSAHIHVVVDGDIRVSNKAKTEAAANNSTKLSLKESK